MMWLSSSQPVANFQERLLLSLPSIPQPYPAPTGNAFFPFYFNQCLYLHGHGQVLGSGTVLQQQSSVFICFILSLYWSLMNFLDFLFPRLFNFIPKYYEGAFFFHYSTIMCSILANRMDVEIKEAFLCINSSNVPGLI